MASTPVHFQAPSGQTVTAHIFALSPDAVIVNTTSTATTEETNKLGEYVCTVTEALAGIYYYHLKISTNVIGTGYVNIVADDTTIYYPCDTYEEAARAITNGDILSLTNIETSIENKIVTHGLDHLIASSCDPGDVVDNSIAARLVSKSVTAAFSDYDHTTDSLQAQAENLALVLGDTGTDGVVLSTATQQSIADTVLNRGASNVEDTADKHSLGAVVMIATNASVAGTTLTAKKPSDDSTFQTYTVTADSDADPITGVS